MATRARLGYVLSDDSIVSVYNHPNGDKQKQWNHRKVHNLILL